MRKINTEKNVPQSIHLWFMRQWKVAPHWMVFSSHKQAFRWWSKAEELLIYLNVLFKYLITGWNKNVILKQLCIHEQSKALVRAKGCVRVAWRPINIYNLATSVMRPISEHASEIKVKPSWMCSSSVWSRFYTFSSSNSEDPVENPPLKKSILIDLKA